MASEGVGEVVLSLTTSVGIVVMRLRTAPDSEHDEWLENMSQILISSIFGLVIAMSEAVLDYTTNDRSEEQMQDVRGTYLNLNSRNVLLFLILLADGDLRLDELLHLREHHLEGRVTDLRGKGPETCWRDGGGRRTTDEGWPLLHSNLLLRRMRSVSLSPKWYALRA